MNLFGLDCMNKAENSEKTILLLDDEEADRTSASVILTREGYTVMEADCFKTALSAFQENRDLVDLLVADISLPDGNGCDLAMQIRDLQPDVRVLFISGHVGAEVCRFYGLDVTDLHFLRKPFTAKQLLGSVRRVLRADNAFPRLYRKSRSAS
jgi:DNA-binding response OmpR family regulator